MPNSLECRSGTRIDGEVGARIVLTSVPHQEPRIDVSCSVNECVNAARRGGLCWAHVKRRSRRQPVHVNLMEKPKTPYERLLEAAFTMLDCKATDDEGWRRARNNLRKSAVRYGRSREGRYESIKP